MTARPTQVRVDGGPVLNAVRVLVAQSTLADHVVIDEEPHTSEVRISDSIPIEMWGSGSQALWDLLLAIATRRHEVSLYDVVSRLDLRNRAAVAATVSALCEVPR